MYKLHKTCRACGYGSQPTPGTKSAESEVMPEVFDLGVQPLSNDFRKEGEPRSGYAPLKVLLCPRCHLGQLSVVVDPEILYSNYSYVTSPGETMRAHFEKLYEDVMSEYPMAATALEIGSNDGRLLAYMQSKGLAVVGVDPARNLCELAEARGVKTWCQLFGNSGPYFGTNNLQKSDVVIARHVFCHVDNWHDFVAALENVTHDTSLICLETPYVHDLIEKCEFDTVYHEHLSYLSIRSVVELLKGTKFYLHRIIRYQIHGGAVLLMLKVRGGGEPHASVQQFLDAEDVGQKRWFSFSRRAQDMIATLRMFVNDARAEGKRVIGLGASAKSTVWVNACGFTRKHIEFIADLTPQKWFTTSPGSDIKIMDEGALVRELPDYVVCFCWNFRVEVLAKNELARSKGVKFVFPVPTLEIV